MTLHIALWHTIIHKLSTSRDQLKVKGHEATLFSKLSVLHDLTSFLNEN